MLKINSQNQSLIKPFAVGELHQQNVGANAPATTVSAPNSASSVNDTDLKKAVLEYTKSNDAQEVSKTNDKQGKNGKLKNESYEYDTKEGLVTVKVSFDENGKANVTFSIDKSKKTPNSPLNTCSDAVSFNNKFMNTIENIAKKEGKSVQQKVSELSDSQMESITRELMKQTNQG